MRKGGENKKKGNRNEKTTEERSRAKSRGEERSRGEKRSRGKRIIDDSTLPLLELFTTVQNLSARQIDLTFDINQREI